MRHIFSAPTVVNIEVTDACNVRCRHCYNFWREDGSRSFSLDKDMMERMIDIIAEAGVFHAVLSGGEPFAAFDVLEYGFKKLQEKHISVSCNSNLMLANDEKIKRLMDVGVDHILTSLNSYDAKINDYMVNKEGAFDRIVKGIDSAVRNGMRVSANMIVSQRNKNHVYKTGKLVYDLGCQKMFGTRVVPSDHIGEKNQPDFVMDKEDAVNTLEQLVKVKEDTGMMIGTLVSYPLCLLSDLERYVDFVGRGCPAQSGHVVNISANGETHACVHQEAGYGNIFEIGIIEPYQKMSTWHTGAYRFKGCDGCDYLEICKTGCRMSSLAYTGKYDQKDNFMVSKDNFVKPFKIVVDDSIYENIDRNVKFTVPSRLRFRKESGFYLLNIRWANTITVSNEIAECLIRYQESGEEFDINDFGKDKKEDLAMLFFKDAVECKEVSYNNIRSKDGLSVDIAALKK